MVQALFAFFQFGILAGVIIVSFDKKIGSAGLKPNVSSKSSTRRSKPEAGGSILPDTILKSSMRNSNPWMGLGVGVSADLKPKVSSKSQ